MYFNDLPRVLVLLRPVPRTSPHLPGDPQPPLLRPPWPSRQTAARFSWRRLLRRLRRSGSPLPGLLRCRGLKVIPRAEIMIPCQTSVPVRMMKLLGVKQIITTNVAGAVNKEYKVTALYLLIHDNVRLEVGDFVFLKDHINFPGYSGRSALTGPNDSRWYFLVLNSTNPSVR